MIERLRRAPAALRWIAAASLVVAALAGCLEDRSRPTVPVFGGLAVFSDPSGAAIALDERDLGVTAPDTLRDVPAGRHLLQLSLSPRASEFFVWRDSVDVPEEAVGSVEGALEGGCGRDCPFQMNVGRIRCRFNGLGDTCADEFFTSGPGLEWPGSRGDYGAGGRLLVAAILGQDAGPLAGDTVATFVYRQAWTGRRPVELGSSSNRQVAEREYWATSLLFPAPLLGLGVQETMVAVDSAGARDLLFIRYRVRNVTDDPRYRRIYRAIPEGGYTFESLYLGFGFDVDVGTAGDDLGTFDPDLDLGFIYDADFDDAALGDDRQNPALVGLIMVVPPEGAGERTLTLWSSAEDWDNGIRTAFAWRVLSGRLAASDPISDHPDPAIGHVSDDPGDYRMTSTRGPLTLAPGESIEMVVAVALAAPESGTFTPGELLRPGDPTDPDRAILRTAEALRALARDAGVIWERYRP